MIQSMKFRATVDSGRQRRHASQLSHLAERARLHDVGQLARFDLTLEVERVIGVVLTELAVNRLELFLEIELALILEERSANFLVELSLEAQQLDFARQHLAHRVEKLRDVWRLEQRLPRLQADREVRRDSVRLALDGVGALHERDDFVRNATVQRDVFLEQREHAAHDDVAGSPRLGAACRFRRRATARRCPDAGRYRVTRARDRALDEDARRPVCLPRCLRDARDDADAMQVARSGFLGVGAALGDEEEEPALRRRRLDGAQRSLAADEKRHRHVGKNDDVAKWKNGETARVGRGHAGR